MNWTALIVVILGIILITIGWQGTHNKVWNIITGHDLISAQPSSGSNSSGSNPSFPFSPSNPGLPLVPPGSFIGL